MDDQSISHTEAAFEMVFPLSYSRDYNRDHIVSFNDFAAFANQWHQPSVVDPNHPSSMLDLNDDGYIGALDLKSFSDFWLARTRGVTKKPTIPTTTSN
jgi:hypothetical protein